MSEDQGVRLNPKGDIYDAQLLVHWAILLQAALGGDAKWHHVAVEAAFPGAGRDGD